jgi:hypothetical protein
MSDTTTSDPPKDRNANATPNPEPPSAFGVRARPSLCTPRLAGADDLGARSESPYARGHARALSCRPASLPVRDLPGQRGHRGRPRDRQPGGTNSSRRLAPATSSGAAADRARAQPSAVARADAGRRLDCALPAADAQWSGSRDRRRTRADSCHPGGAGPRRDRLWPAGERPARCRCGARAALGRRRRAAHRTARRALDRAGPAVVVADPSLPRARHPLSVAGTFPSRSRSRSGGRRTIARPRRRPLARSPERKRSSRGRRDRHSARALRLHVAARRNGALSREDRIQAALQAPSDGRPSAVAVERLAARLQTTKGSFYWHFNDGKAFAAYAIHLD